MIIEKHLERQILRDYFFISGKIKIDHKYFIKKIEEGIVSSKNLTNQTYVRDQMTCWDYFKFDPKFVSFLEQLIDFIDKNIKLPKYELTDAWGYKMNSGGETREHDHMPNIWSGVLYLNKHEQSLDFREIKESVIPDIGRFVLFSSHLQHNSLKHRFKNAKYGISFNVGMLPLEGVS